MCTAPWGAQDLQRLLLPGREKVQDRMYAIRSMKWWVGFGESRIYGITSAWTPWLAFSSRGRYAGGVLRRAGDRIQNTMMCRSYMYTLCAEGRAYEWGSSGRAIPATL